MTDYMTDEVRAIIGARSDWIDATEPVQSSETRRFAHGIMDPNPLFYDADRARGSRYGAPIAPLAFPVHAFRRGANEAQDPLADAGDPDYDGLSRALRPGLPSVPVPLSGILNGGYEYEFFSYPQHGARIKCRSTYQDIYQKQGKAGPMVMVVIADEYVTEDGRPLLKSLNTMIMR